MWRGIGFIRQAKLMLTRFVRLRGLPEEIARGMALGIFIGMTPTMGLQMPIALVFATILKENRLAAAQHCAVRFPAPALCGDNAAMLGVPVDYYLRQGRTAGHDVEPLASWALDTADRS